MFKLETENLILRDMQLSDESSFVEISQDAKYQRFYSESDSDPDKYKQLTKLFVEQSLEVPRKSYQLAIESKQTGIFIGIVCLRLEAEWQASMGCGISRQFQGHGFIYEAVKKLASFGFNELDIHRIYAETISQNLAAIKLCKSLGMRQEAYYRENRFFKGQWWDTVVLAMLRSEWQQS
ncbi:GNAT family protein [Vibrio cidicii]|uniref:GNAT family N-acetyltransferase n=1 Tax=Vibrio cidicii TaxID=1763883 RepID=UPI0037508E6E|nr:GNAT family N-acetyltransferase [Vibrio navarrensis]EJL6568326.1 GNAT family N-acetyltransferase [Vibrio navarrensis]